MTLPHSSSSRIWHFLEDPKISAKWDRYIMKGYCVEGIKESDASSAYIYRDDQKHSTEIPIDPSSFVPPRVIFPGDGFAPDWFSFSGYHFCSAKMAAALAQPDSVIQYLPIIFDCDGEVANMKDYRLMRIRAYQRALDLQKSEYDLWPHKGHKTGIMFFGISTVFKYELIDNFTPKTELFREEEDRIMHVFATDSLAERVLKAGCTGLRFVGLDASSYYAGGRPFTVRTAKGTKIITR